MCIDYILKIKKLYNDYYNRNMSIKSLVEKVSKYNNSIIKDAGGKCDFDESQTRFL